MSVSWDIGFRKKPNNNELDQFMQSLGYEIESPDQRGGEFTRVYVLCDDSVPREIEFFYEDEVSSNLDLFGERGK
ncbi:MAG: hypothetical protein V1870_03120 [Candidatus Aenigmatarchaeota archaeon]